MKFPNFFRLLWVIFALLDPDPDRLTRLNPDPIQIRIRNPGHTRWKDWRSSSADLNPNHDYVNTNFKQQKNEKSTSSPHHHATPIQI
jgi:hypothetical protein